MKFLLKINFYLTFMNWIMTKGTFPIHNFIIAITMDIRLSVQSKFTVKIKKPAEFSHPTGFMQRISHHFYPFRNDTLLFFPCNHNF